MNLWDILDDVLAVFERSGTHTTRALARNARGEKVRPTSPYATCWCVIGATLHACRVDRIMTGSRAEAVTYLLQRAAEELGHTSTVRCNDERGKAGAVALVKRARHLLDTYGPPTRAQLDEGSTT